MSGVAGKKTRVKVSTTETGGTDYLIAGIRQAQVSINNATVDDSEFGSDWMQKLPTLSDCTISLTGNRRMADTNGQNVLMAQAFGGGAIIWITYLPDNGASTSQGFRIPMIVSKVGESSDVGGVVEFTCELEGAGTPVAV